MPKRHESFKFRTFRARTGARMPRHALPQEAQPGELEKLSGKPPAEGVAPPPHKNGSGFGPKDKKKRDLFA